MPAQILDTPVPVAACPVSRAGGSRLSPRGSRKTTSCLRRAPAHLPAALRCARARPLALAAATLHPTLIGRCARSTPDCPDAWNAALVISWLAVDTRSDAERSIPRLVYVNLAGHGRQSVRQGAGADLPCDRRSARSSFRARPGAGADHTGSALG